MPDLSDVIQIGGVFYRLRLVAGPLIDAVGESCMCCIDDKNNELLISSDVPEAKRLIVAAHVTGAAFLKQFPHARLIGRVA